MSLPQEHPAERHLVNDLEMLDQFGVLRVMHRERELHFLAGLERPRRDRHDPSELRRNQLGYVRARVFIPQRGQTPGVFDRTSGSMGHW